MSQCAEARRWCRRTVGIPLAEVPVVCGCVVSVSNKAEQTRQLGQHIQYIQYQFGRGILKMVGPKKQDFWPKIKGNCCILRIGGAPIRQKLGLILENKVVQKLKLEKKCFFYKKWSPKLIFNEVFLKKFRRFLT